MMFKVKKVEMETDGHGIVYLRYEDARKFNINVGDRIQLSFNKKKLVGVVNLCKSAVSLNEIGVSKEVWEDGIAEKVKISLLTKPKSVKYIRKRLLGTPLKRNEIREIIFDLMENKLSSVEAAYFVASAYVQRLSFEEEEAMTRAMVDAGKTISFSKGPIVDKHCIGGVPGNRTTPIVIPIIAAAGYLFPKTSSRAITSPAGTADVMEVLCNIEYSAKDMKKIVKKVGAAMIWGGSVNLAPVDDILLKLRYPLRLDPTSFLLASILAKKKSAGSQKVLIDIPMGAKVKDPKAAKNLAHRFQYLGKRLGMEVRSVITDGFQPIGKGVGPSLEARDVITVLQGKGPKDLREKSLRLAAEIFDMVGKRNGYAFAKKILDSGKAYQKFKQIIKAQGGNPDIQAKDIEIGKYSVDVFSQVSTSYLYYDSNIISQLARLAGAPAIKGAGVELLALSGSKVKKGKKILRIITPVKDRITLIEKFLKENDPLISRNVIIETI